MSRTLSRLTTLFMLIAILSPAFTIPSAHATTKGRSELISEFQSAAREYKVPTDLLMAMGYVNTHWEMPSSPSIDHGWGIMHLVSNRKVHTLKKASALTNLPVKQLKRDRLDNIRGGAALLSQAQGSSRRDDLKDWYAAVKRFGGQIYADQVFSTLHQGATKIVSGERVVLPPNPAVASLDHDPPGADYPGANWLRASSSNFTTANRPKSNHINKIVIHVTQGSYASTINWFQDPASGVSAHYVVRSSDGRITQMVHNKDIAYHSGNRRYNQTSIGIEHEGFTNDPSWFTENMYRSSARLVAYLSLKYHIPIDRQHIIGHSQVPDPYHPGEYGGANHHRDPGPNWNWTLYMSYVKQFAAQDTSIHCTDEHPTPPALTYKVVNTNGTGLDLHACPNTNSTVLTNLPEGTIVNEIPSTVDGWVKTAYNGKTGYIWSGYLQVVPHKPQPQAQCAPQHPTPPGLIYEVIDTGDSGLNLRACPDTDSKRLAVLPEGTVVREIPSTVDGWVKTTYNGQTGYLWSGYLKAVGRIRKPPAKCGDDHPTPPGLTYQVFKTHGNGEYLRECPTMESKPLAIVPGGHVVHEIPSTLDGWVKTTYNGKTGYLWNEYLDVVKHSK